MECPEAIVCVEEGSLSPKTVSGRSDLSGLYHLGRTLGRGHFAVVKLARHVNTGQLVAVKIINKTKLDVMATSHLLQEVRCMRRVQHPNVVRLYEVIDTPSTLYLVMELAEGGDLYDYIQRHDGGVAEGTAKRHFAQIVRAVSYCHRLHVVHRDLKPENVVFFPQQGAVKLTDFGFSNLFQPGTMLATSCGSLAYSAPEILLGEEYDAPAVDIWSLGVILYMLVCGVPPFYETNDSETLVMILDCRYRIPEHVSDHCRHLISRMLQKDPTSRATLEEIEAHDWLKGLEDALLTPEAPPSWLSGALSPSSPRSAPESGDLLAAKPATHTPFPGPWQPRLSVTLRPAPAPAPEPPAQKSLLGLQQICEEEDEEEEEEEDGTDEGPPMLLTQTDEKLSLEVEKRETVKIMEEPEEKAVDKDFVISEQPVSLGDVSASSSVSVPETVTDSVSLQCQEPNNNSSKPAPFPSAPALSSPDLLDSKDTHVAHQELDQRAEEGCRKKLSADRLESHNPLQNPDSVPRAETAKRHSLKLRERIFQFPLCEKAMTFNIPTQNKSKTMPLAQYNCCRVL
ncbi:SNF related kinase b [Eucyclogobius newberryi]|uniref:SNF related kinase b n=1 Tax=Eucyclogobius newberryi TaxID=166745 RepID=UPI003B5AF9A7